MVRYTQIFKLYSNETIYVVKSNFWVHIPKWYWVYIKNEQAYKIFESADGLGFSKRTSKYEHCKAKFTL